MAEIYSLSKNVHLCWSIWAPRTFLFVDQSLPFFSPNVEGVVVDLVVFRNLHCVDPFYRYSWSKSKMVRNRAEFWTFFSPSQILGGRPSKSYTHFITPASRSRGTSPGKKVLWGYTPTSPEVMAQMLNFHD